MDIQFTPADLARELGVSQRSVRDHLRRQYGTLVAPTTRWLLDAEQAGNVRRHFTDER